MFELRKNEKHLGYLQAFDPKLSKIYIGLIILHNPNTNFSTRYFCIEDKKEYEDFKLEKLDYDIFKIDFKLFITYEYGYEKAYYMFEGLNYAIY